jgi:hypothetical protein
MLRRSPGRRSWRPGRRAAIGGDLHTAYPFVGGPGAAVAAPARFAVSEHAYRLARETV